VGQNHGEALKSATQPVAEKRDKTKGSLRAQVQGLNPTRVEERDGGRSRPDWEKRLRRKVNMVRFVLFLQLVGVVTTTGLNSVATKVLKTEKRGLKTRV